MHPPVPEPAPLRLADGICFARPHGASSLVGAVELIRNAITHCRERGVSRLLFNATALTGVEVPSLVDRFLMVEDWATAAKRMVIVALVIHPEYIHPEKFGVVLARDLGLTCEVFTSEESALPWLTGSDPV